MLVLSRRVDETIVFPHSGITVRVLKVRGGVVKIGVEAPPEVAVLRQELATASPPSRPAAPSAGHALKNRLNKVGLFFHLFEKQHAAGLHSEAQATLAKAFASLEALEADLAAGTLESLRPATPPARPLPPGLKTLLVEDDVNERELLANILRMNGCDCDTAGDGEAALDYLATNERPDVVLLDLWMPRCDGQQTLARIRQDRRLHDLRVFAISGTTPREAGVGTGKGGFDAWIPKPLNPRQLFDALKSSPREAR